jgi:hypothetical protein
MMKFHMRSDVKLIEQVIRIVGIIAIVALLLVGGAILPAAAVSVWSVPMTAATNSEGSNPNLTLGTNTGATDGFDSGIDVPHAPPAPGATFDAYFSIVHPLFPQLDKDYRAPTGSIQWTLHVQSSTQQITLSWDTSGVPVNVSLRLTGSGLNVDMKTTSNTTLPAGIHSLTIAATEAPPPTPTPTPATPTPTSPAGGGGGGGGGGFCFIATAAYGSSLDSHVDTLRSFRDQYLETNPIGSAFVSLYYKVSPPMADFIDEHPTLKPIVRAGLWPAVAMSSVALNTTLAEKAVILVAMALFAAVLIKMWLMRRTRRLERR